MVRDSDLGHALLYLDTHYLKQFLDLPEGVKIEWLFMDNARRALGIHLSGDQLPLCEEGAEPTRAWARVEQQWVELEPFFSKLYLTRITVDLPERKDDAA